MYARRHYDSLEPQSYSRHVLVGTGVAALCVCAFLATSTSTTSLAAVGVVPNRVILNRGQRTQGNVRAASVAPRVPTSGAAQAGVKAAATRVEGAAPVAEELTMETPSYETSQYEQAHETSTTTGSAFFAILAVVAAGVAAGFASLFYSQKQQAPAAAMMSVVTGDSRPRRQAFMTVDGMTLQAQYMLSRQKTVQKYYPTAMSMDDFLARVEMALCAFGFTPDNSIAVLNVCRDEATNELKGRVEDMFPLVFNINGLGGGLTCGVIGVKAGLSHAPDVEGRPRYIFMSFPHIAIDPTGELGALGRPGQSKTGCACGAMAAALGQLKEEGVEDSIVKGGVHSVDDPEYTILKQRIARRIANEDKDIEKLNLAEFTALAERQISDDLDYLISQAVDPETADYAVVTGVEIHNWGMKFENEEPNLEFIAPSHVSVCVNGKKQELDLSRMPPLTPRQMRLVTGTTATDSKATTVYANGATISGLDMFNEMGSGVNDKAANDAIYKKLLGQ